VKVQVKTSSEFIEKENLIVPTRSMKGFVFQDSLFVYGGEGDEKRDLFLLNLGK